jgi:hypothetical protein
LFANALPTALLAEIRVYLRQQKAWERIDSAPESRPERGASPRPARWAGRRERRIVPDTFLDTFLETHVLAMAGAGG